VISLCHSARRDFTYEFSKGERIGICGPNGSGKTTLVRTLTGALPLAGGEREVGDTTVIGHFAQQPPPVPEHLRIIDYLRWVGWVLDCLARTRLQGQRCALC